MQTRNERANVLHSLGGDPAPTEFERSVLTEIALDETEDKTNRKRAIRALLPVGIAEEDFRELVRSPEQGVSRSAVEHLDRLLADRSQLAGFLDFCVQTANESDDVGLARRLVTKVLDLSLAEGPSALQRLDLSEIGARRRLTVVLEAHEDAIGQEGLRGSAAGLLARCLIKTADDGWIAKCRAFLERLQGSDVTKPQ